MSQRRVITAVFLLLPLLGVAVIFRDSLRKLWISRAFAEEQLGQYEKLFAGEAPGVPSETPPSRTGKVIVLRPSSHQFVVSGGMSVTLFWTQIAPELRGKITGDVDPASLHDSWYDLDSSLRASTPDEVDTVILCETMTTKDGIYVAKDHPDRLTPFDARRRDQVLRAYDRRSGKFLGACFVRGEDSPERTTAWGPHMGKATSVAEVVARMPVQQGR